MSSRALDLKQARSRLEELVDQAARGEEIILTQKGEPVAKIIPIARRVIRRRFGSAKGLIHIRKDFDQIPDDFGEYI